ncbi:MAG TPA: hypothetical protein VGW38_23205 [Chloroflexota bacterium]|nr:hypothetical protein [Chloroflexota bacterium]
MRATRLIFVEGIMGAGKSTTATFLTKHLEQHGFSAAFMSEGGFLRLALDLPHPLAVWRDVTVDEYIARSLRKWDLFVQEAQQSASPVVTVCDGLLFHGNMTDLLLMNAEPAILERYVTQVLTRVQDLHPVAIYFVHADVAQAVRAACDARGSKWEAYQVNWKLSSPYATQRSLQGFEGLVQLYRSYRAVCDALFEQFTLPKLAIDNEGDWTTYYREVLTFLQLSVPPAEKT